MPPPVTSAAQPFMAVCWVGFVAMGSIMASEMFRAAMSFLSPPNVPSVQGCIPAIFSSSEDCAVPESDAMARDARESAKAWV